MTIKKEIKKGKTSRIKKEQTDIIQTDIIICKHCHKTTTHPGLVGISLICPYCNRPVNGN